jgi:DNA polymerase-3 subunit beta
VSLSATNQEIAIVATVSGDKHNMSPTETLLPVGKMSQILREAHGDLIEIQTTDRGVTVRADRSEFRLQSADPAEFPAVPTFGDSACWRVRSDALAQAIRRTAFAADVESSRFALAGALWEFADDKLTMVATDTRRLAVTSCPTQIEQGITEPTSQVIVPKKTLETIARILGGDEYAMIVATGNSITIRVGLVTIHSRLVEGRFPQYKAVIPIDPPRTVDIPAGALLGAVRQAQIVTSDDSRGVDFAFDTQTLTLRSSAAEVGQSQIEVPITLDGDPVTVTLDPRYLADFLKAITPETNVRIGLTDAESSVLFSTDDGYRYVVMPLTRD